MDENRIKTQNSPFPLPVVPMQSANVNQTNESKNQWLIDETRLRAVVLFFSYHTRGSACRLCFTVRSSRTKKKFLKKEAASCSQSSLR